LRPNSTSSQEESGGQNSKGRKNPEQPCSYRLIRLDINPLYERIPWHSGQITIETALNEIGRHAPGAMKNRERKKRKRLNAKPNAPQPKFHPTTNRLDG
jgi:hypothetical protein